MEMWYEFEEPFVLDHGKFEMAFRDIATPIRESVQQTLAWYRQNPA